MVKAKQSFWPQTAQPIVIFSGEGQCPTWDGYPQHLYAFPPIPLIASMLLRVRLSNLRVLQRYFAAYSQNEPPVLAEADC